MEKLKGLKPQLLFHLLLNTVVVLFITGASYYHTPLEGFKDHAVYLIHLFVLQSTVAGGLYLLSLNRWLFKIGFSVLFLAFGCFSFWAYTQDLSITSSLIQAVFETKPDIVIDVLTWPYLLFIVAMIVTLVLIMKAYAKIRPRAHWKLFFPAALLCCFGFYVMEQKRPGSLKNRLPYNVYYGVQTYMEKPDLELQLDVHAIRKANDSPQVVFVLGETVRADHLSLNGYERTTMPLLEQRSNLTSFPKMFTEHTYTGASVPQILTNQRMYDSIGPYTSIYSLANAAGVGTTWIGNQTLESSFEPIVQTNDEVLLIDAFKSEFSFAKAMDMELLKPLDSILDRPHAQLTTLHMIGSHWWYENRYLEEHRRFTPVIDSKYVPSLDAQALINSYDNTIVYLDDFLDRLIGMLEAIDGPAVMVYLADHGESLGEDGRWLHAQGGDESKNPAFIIWFSDSFADKYPKQAASFELLKDSPMSTDVIYPLIAELLSIEEQ